MWERVGVIIRKEFIQMLREPRMRFLLFLPPVLQLVIFGYAVTLDVDTARIAWMDMDHTPESRALLARFEGSGRFKVVAYPRSEADVQNILDRSQAHGVVRVLPGFARDLLRGRSTEVQILLDGTNSNTASLVSSYASQVIGAFSVDMQPNQLVDVVVRNGGASPHQASALVLPRTRVWFNADLYSRNYFVPGTAANILLMITLMLTAQAIIREKEIGTLEQLMVTPMRPIELMLGKTLPFAVVGMVDMLIITGAALLLFHVPFRGNFFLLIFCAALFLMTSLGAGLFLSTISNTQQQAVMMSFFFNTPAFMLSGFTFPIRNMPEVVQYLTYLDPLRYFMEIIRGIFLKGVGVEVLWPKMLAMFVYGAAVLGMSAMRCRKKLDSGSCLRGQRRSGGAGGSSSRVTILLRVSQVDGSGRFQDTWGRRGRLLACSPRQPARTPFLILTTTQLLPTES